MQMKQTFVAQLAQLPKCWLFSLQSGMVWRRTGLFLLTNMGCRQFWVHLISLLSILLRCNGFAGIQKAVVDQTGSRPPNRDHDLFFGVSLTLGSAWKLLLGPTTELVIASCHIKPLFITYHNLIEKWFVALVWNERK